MNARWVLHTNLRNVRIECSCCWYRACWLPFIRTNIPSYCFAIATKPEEAQALRNSAPSQRVAGADDDEDREGLDFDEAELLDSDDNEPSPLWPTKHANLAPSQCSSPSASAAAPPKAAAAACANLSSTAALLLDPFGFYFPPCFLVINDFNILIINVVGNLNHCYKLISLQYSIQ
jgi:hypothetical protein